MIGDNFSNKVASMTPGQALMDVPIPKLIEYTAKSIAAAQFELDASAVRAATLLSETKIDFKDIDGKSTQKSLLELGFSPSFYHFEETEMEFKVSVTVKVEAGIDFGVSGNISGSKDSDTSDENSSSNQAFAYGASMSLDVHHKYGFDMSASSTVRTVMKAVPPPQVFITTLQNHAAAGGTIDASDVPDVDENFDTVSASTDTQSTSASDSSSSTDTGDSSGDTSSADTDSSSSSTEDSGSDS